jgi:hypothetical protein
LSLCDFWFFGYAKEQLITDRSDLEDKLTDIWEHISRNVLQSVFFKWIERLECVIEHERDYDINPYSFNKKFTDRSREKQGGHNFCYPHIMGVGSEISALPGCVDDVDIFGNLKPVMGSRLWEWPLPIGAFHGMSDEDCISRC